MRRPNIVMFFEIVYVFNTITGHFLMIVFVVVVVWGFFCLFCFLAINFTWKNKEAIIARKTWEE